VKFSSFLALLTLVNAQGPFDPNEICIGYQDFDKIGYGDDVSCTGYYECEAEYGYEMECEEGLQFNYETNDCDDADFVQCQEPDNGNYPEYPQETDAPNPTQTAPTQSTTTTQMPSMTTTSINNGITEGPIDDITCPTDQPGKILFFPSSNCSEYFICANGNKLKMTCLEDFTWNQDTQQCDFPIFSRGSVSFKIPGSRTNANIFFLNLFKN